MVLKYGTIVWNALLKACLRDSFAAYWKAALDIRSFFRELEGFFRELEGKLEGFFRESEGFLGRSGKLLAKNTLYTYQVSEKELCLGLAELHLWQSSRMKHDIIFKDTYQWGAVYFTSS